MYIGRIIRMFIGRRGSNGGLTRMDGVEGGGWLHLCKMKMLPNLLRKIHGRAEFIFNCSDSLSALLCHLRIGGGYMKELQKFLRNIILFTQIFPLNCS